MADKSFLYDVDTSKVQKLLKETQNNSDYFNNIANKIVDGYSKHLDDLMKKVYQEIVTDSSQVSDDELEKYCFELTSLLYFMGQKLQHIGTLNDLSEAVRQQVYNSAYLNNQIKDSERKNKTTVAENQAVASQESKYESVIADIYNRCHTSIKYKIDAGNKMVDVIKKIISKRMLQMEIENKAPTNARLLVEEV